MEKRENEKLTAALEEAQSGWSRAMNREENLRTALTAAKEEIAQLKQKSEELKLTIRGKTFYESSDSKPAADGLDLGLLRLFERAVETGLPVPAWRDALALIRPSEPVLRLDAEDSAHLEAALLGEAQPNEALRSAAARFDQLVDGGRLHIRLAAEGCAAEKPIKRRIEVAAQEAAAEMDRLAEECMNLRSFIEQIRNAAGVGRATDLVSFVACMHAVYVRERPALNVPPAAEGTKQEALTDAVERVRLLLRKYPRAAAASIDREDLELLCAAALNQPSPAAQAEPHDCYDGAILGPNYDRDINDVTACPKCTAAQAEELELLRELERELRWQMENAENKHGRYEEIFLKLAAIRARGAGEKS